MNGSPDITNKIDKWSDIPEPTLPFQAPKPTGRRARKPGIDRKPRQAYSAKQLEKLEGEFKVGDQ